MDQLKNKTLKGLMYLGMGKGAAKLISFVNTLILARLLTPEDYGLMAIVMVIVGFIGFFNEIGLGAAIKHRAEISAQELNGAFCLAVLISSAYIAHCIWPAHGLPAILVMPNLPACWRWSV